MNDITNTVKSPCCMFKPHYPTVYKPSTRYILHTTMLIASIFCCNLYSFVPVIMAASLSNISMLNNPYKVRLFLLIIDTVCNRLVPVNHLWVLYFYINPRVVYQFPYHIHFLSLPMYLLGASTIYMYGVIMSLWYYGNRPTCCYSLYTKYIMHLYIIKSYLFE